MIVLRRTVSVSEAGSKNRKRLFEDIFGGNLKQLWGKSNNGVGEKSENLVASENLGRTSLSESFGEPLRQYQPCSPLSPSRPKTLGSPNSRILQSLVKGCSREA